MPVPIGSGQPTPEPLSQAPQEGVRVAAATWIDPTGVHWPLTDFDTSPWFTTDDGITGLGAAPRTITSVPVPRGGAKVTNIQPGARVITWPLCISALNHDLFVAAWRKIAGAFTMTRRLGPGYLVVEQPDGSRRRVAAYYQEGFDNSSSGGMWVEGDVCTITLFCPSPWWFDADPDVIPKRFGDEVYDFQDPYISVGPSATLGAAIVVNDGDTETWPEWTITGPAHLITAENNTTGQSFVVDPTKVLPSGADLAVGETITITGDPPLIQGPTPAAGKNWNQAIDWATSKLWYLQPGGNDIDFSVDGGDVGTSITATITKRYETA